MKRNRTDWRRYVGDRYEHYEERLVQEAINRLRNGDVSLTVRGIRVTVREDLGDDRADAKAYWTNVRGEEPRHCKCHEMRTTGQCGHKLAALMYQDSVEQREAA